ncbi:MAG: tryptophan synthase subunit alpha, partial [Bacteroidia bacterium]|nr:tryptophan synthase subunit alpha [Bacteroidia bacterium]
KGSIDNEQEKYFNKVKNMKLKNPLMIGFGISDNETFKKASMFASGAIIGSAFIKAIDSKGDLKSSIHNFIKSIR